MSDQRFLEDALRLFTYQSEANPLYKKFLQGLHVDPHNITSLEAIPCLPISFFKTHEVKTGEFDPAICFESSGTTGMVNSKHCISDLMQYLNNTVEIFKEQYGDPSAFCFLGLLPSYLERSNSSLVAMVDHLIHLSNHPLSGFFLNDFSRLNEVLKALEAKQQKTILIGVTYALLDFVESFPSKLNHTIIMETGGMKGRKKEITRDELHQTLKSGFGVDAIHAEYGMTELMSQAYSKGNGIYYSNDKLKVILRSTDDPFETWNQNEHIHRTGVINVIDLANRDSVSFIATDDLARFTGDGGFEMMGRIDRSDIRGCSLLTA